MINKISFYPTDYKKAIALFWLILFNALYTGAQQKIDLWEKGKMPNSKGLSLTDSISNERIFRISSPRMHVFLPSKDDNNGTAILILPGGGYNHLTYNLGGFQIAKWFNSLGICAFVLDYRLPGSPDLINRETGPLQDAQRAIKIIREKSRLWNIDEKKIGVLGTSAGGHLASLLATSSNDITEVHDSLGTVSFHPDFMILISPLIDLSDSESRESRQNLLGMNPSVETIRNYSSQNRVNGNTPPCFIVQAQDDPAVSVNHSLLFFQALLNKKIPVSYHVFPYGAHKIGVNNNQGSTGLWKQLCEQWLREMKLLSFTP